MSKKKVVVVLGMHRSGTSAIARGLKALGVDLGDNLMPPAPNNNERGFWEDMDIYRFNERLLGELGASWDQIAPVETSVLLGEKFANARHDASSLLSAKLSAAPVFGFKDPRTSILLPFWKCVFEDLELDDSYVIACRNPLEVAASLQKRDSFDTRFGLFLWLSYTWAAISNTSDRSRIVLSYERLMVEPVAELARIASFLGLEQPHASAPAVSEYLKDFLSPELHHNRFSNKELQRRKGFPSTIKHVFTSLQEWAGSESGFELPQKLRQETENYLERSRYLLELSDLLKRQVSESDWARAKLQSTADQQSARLEERAERIAALEAVSAGLKTDVETLQHQLDAAAADLVQRNNQIAELETSDLNLRSETGLLRQQLAAATSDIERLKVRITVQEASQSNTQAELNSYKEQLFGANAERESLLSEAGTLQQKLEEAVRELADREQKNSALEFSITAMRAEISDLSARLDAAGRRSAALETMAAENAAAATAYEEMASGLQQQLATVSNLLQERDRQLAEMDAAAKSANAERDAAGRRSAALETMAAENAAAATAYEEMASGLQQQLATVSNLLQERDRQLAEMDAAAKSANAEVAEVSEALRLMQHEISAASEREQNVRVSLLGEVELRKRTVQAFETRAVEFQQQLQAAAELISERDRQLEDAIASIGSLRAEVIERTKALRLARHELHAASSRESATQADLKREVQKALDELKSQGIQLKESEDLRNILTAEVERLLRVNERNARELEQARSAFARSEERLKLSENSRAELLTLKSDRDLEVGQLTSALEEAHNLVESQRAESAEKTVSLRLLRHEVHALRSSTSWKITAPIRALSRLLTRTIRVFRLRKP